MIKAGADPKLERMSCTRRAGGRPSTRRADRYLAAFAQLEAHLRRRAGSERLRFNALIDQLASIDPVVAYHASALKEHGEIRNFLSHRGRVRPIAEPYAATIAQVEALREAVIDPPSALDALGSIKVEICRADEPVSRALEVIIAGDFSQVPVVDGAEIVGLLTAETVARWIGFALREGVNPALDEPVARALPRQEPSSGWELLGTNASVYDVLGRFDSWTSAGKSLDAILFTRKAAHHTPIKGIATPFDMPRLSGALDRHTT